MNSLLDDTEDEDDHRGHHHRGGGGDREITLGTTMILLIFFALAVYGAVLFGFGYSLGSKHSGGTTLAAAPQTSGAFGNFKPAPGNPLGTRPGDKPPPVDTTPLPYTPPPARTAPAPAPAPIERPVVSAQAEDVAAVAPPRTPPASAVSAPVAAPAGPPMAVPVGGVIVVQVAAVSHQEDADLIATTLRRRGYLVNVRTEADHLLHVQVGPFPTRKDADAMKARLLADGFNAYIK